MSRAGGQGAEGFILAHFNPERQGVHEQPDGLSLRIRAPVVLGCAQRDQAVPADPVLPGKNGGGGEVEYGDVEAAGEERSAAGELFQFLRSLVAEIAAELGGASRGLEAAGAEVAEHLRRFGQARLPVSGVGPSLVCFEIPALLLGVILEGRQTEWLMQSPGE